MTTRGLCALVAAAIIAVPAVPALAATVQVDFLIEITEGTAPPPGGSAIGQTFNGTLTFDDADVTPGSAFIRSPGAGNLTMIFPFIDRTLTEIDSDLLPDEPEASFAADGSFTGLLFSVDVPNSFFIFSNGLEFSYDYSRLDADGNQITVAGGKGILSQEVAPIPLPATAPLLAAALIGGALSVRRRRSRA